MKGKRFSKFVLLAYLSVFLIIFWIGHDTVFPLALSLSTSSSEEKTQSITKLSARDAQILKYAEELFQKEQRRLFQTKHYVVITDHPKSLAAQAVATTFESIRDLYKLVFSHAFALRKGEYKTHILLFRYSWAYERFFRKASYGETHKTSGSYIPGTHIIASHYEHHNERDFYAVIIHEGIHQLNDQILYSKDVSHSIWVEEGLAEYFAHTKMNKRGEFKMGKLDWKTSYVKVMLPELQKLIKKKKHIKLEDLISCDRDTFYEEKHLEYYSESWFFIHFLLHYEKGKYGKKFTDYMRYEIEGMGGLESFKKVFGDRLEIMEKQFLDYVRKL